MEKITSDDSPSVNEFFKLLINDKELFETKILEMQEEEVIAFYEYVLSITSKLEENGETVEQNSEDLIWYIKGYLELLEVIENYLNTKEEKNDLTEEDEKIIADTIRIIEERKNPSPLKRLIRYIKG